MQISICKPVAAEVALLQTTMISPSSAMISPSSASLLSNVPSPIAQKYFCNKSSWYVGNCTRRSFKTYALASTTTSIHPTLYDILGVQQDVELLEIKRAFRHQARQHHPDVCTSADTTEATNRFIQLKEAYDTLSNPNLKASYDQQLNISGSSSSFNFAMGSPSKSRMYRRTQSVSASHQWEDQLSGLRNKYQRADWPMQESRGSTWGERMRQRVQEHNSHVASVNKQTL